MELNSDQIKIVNQLNNFIFDLKNKNKFYLLTGLAGTGKTSLITYFLSLPVLNNMKIAVTGCTNKAVGVLESLYLKNHIIKENPKEKDLKEKDLKEKDLKEKDLKEKDLKEIEVKKDDKLNFLTIHKLLQIKRKIDANGHEVFESIIDENNIKIKAKSIFYYDLIIITVSHDYFKELGINFFKKSAKKNHLIFDVKSIFKSEDQNYITL
jgi:mannitol-specific phosphotransferase system IIBC component